MFTTYQLHTNYNDGIDIYIYNDGAYNDSGYIYIYTVYHYIVHTHTVLSYRKPVSGIDVINVKKHH